jgi:hypothetical protein
MNEVLLRISQARRGWYSKELCNAVELALKHSSALDVDPGVVASFFLTWGDELLKRGNRLGAINKLRLAVDFAAKAGATATGSGEGIASVRIEKEALTLIEIAEKS